MMLQRNNLVRVFNYAGVRLPDPDVTLSPAEVLEFLAATGRPELTGAEISGPEVEGECLVYSLVRRTGTKGRGAATAKSGSKLHQAAADHQDLLARINRANERMAKLAVSGGLADALQTLRRNRGKTAVVLPSEHNLWIA